MAFDEGIPRDGEV